jgi:hypothetical protein
LTPTPAQIEAVEKVLAQGGDTTAQTFIDLLSEEGFALTAAAEVGEPKLKTLTDAIYAAAEAADKYADGLKQFEAATIERCAQVAASKYYWRNGDDCAAAIRALKDKP